MENIKAVLKKFIETNFVNEKIDIQVVENKDKENGYYYSTISFKLVKILQKSPYECGKFLKSNISCELKDYKIQVCSNGFMNFHLSTERVLEIFKTPIILVKNEKVKIAQEIIYYDKRIKNIINLLKLDNILVEDENFDIHKFNTDQKILLNKLIRIYELINNRADYKLIVNETKELCENLEQYEEKVIIKYLSIDELKNLIIILKYAYNLFEIII